MLNQQLKKRIKHNYFNMRKTHEWKSSEVAFIKEHYPTKSTQKIAMMMGMDHRQVCSYTSLLIKRGELERKQKRSTQTA